MLSINWLETYNDVFDIRHPFQVAVTKASYGDMVTKRDSECVQEGKRGIKCLEVKRFVQIVKQKQDREHSVVLNAVMIIIFKKALLKSLERNTVIR
jgi:hypothetical protein